MAAKAGTLIGGENAPIHHFSAIINNNTKTTTSFSAATPASSTIHTSSTRNGLRIRFPQRAPNSAIRATSGPNSNEPDSPTKSPSASLRDDLSYLLKLAIGSVFGAALIKYGSAAVPEITRPNISLALLMISSPVVVAVLLLIKGSGKE